MHEVKPKPQQVPAPATAVGTPATHAVAPSVQPMSAAGRLRRTLGNQALQRLVRPAPPPAPAAVAPDLPATAVLQTKLAVGAPSDPLEQEADRVAEAVVGVAEPATGRNARGAEPIRLKRAVPDEAAPRDVTARVGQVLRSPGDPLSGAALDVFEPRLQRRLDAVRVHTGSLAEAAAVELGARAFASGRHIVFGPGQFAPGTMAGNRLIAHELAHVVQQGEAPAGAPQVVRRQPSPTSPVQLTDPIGLSDLPDFGFSAVGPEFTGVPQDNDIRQVLGETGVADPTALAESTPSPFKMRDGDTTYMAYVHPTLGVVARANAAPYNPVSDPSRYIVYAYVRTSDSLKYRPVGGLGQRKPTVSLDPMSGGALRITDIFAGLRLVEDRLASLAAKYPAATDPALATGLTAAKADVAAMRAAATASPAQLATVQTAIDLLERTEYDLGLIDKQRANLAAVQAPARSVDALRVRYGTVLQRLLQSDAMSRYDEAQRWAERLPADIALDTLKARGEVNQGTLGPSDTLVAWTGDLRARLDTLYDKRQQLAAKPGDPALTKQVNEDAAFLSAALTGIQGYGEYLVNFEAFLRNRPGILDTPLIDAMHRLRERVDAIKAAYDRHDTSDLKTRAEALQGDKDVKDFYRALPAGMQITQMIGRVGVATLAGLATGGVGGIFAGGARAAALGLTARGALVFAGTAVLEAATFTAVNTTLSHALFGDKVTFGSLLKDFLWNVGLFAVLRGLSTVSETALRTAELQALNAPVQLVTGFPLSYGYGVVRFRVENNRWPSSAELGQMTTESILMLAAVAVTSQSVQRAVSQRKLGALLRFHQKYGWRFEALDTFRGQLGENVRAAEAAKKGNDTAAVDDAKAKAKALESGYQDILKEVLADKDFQVPQLRKELNELRNIDAAADVLADALGLPADIGVRRQGRFSYTYASGNTTALEDALKSRYTVAKASDAATGLRTIRATSSMGGPDLLFQERTAGTVEIDSGLYDVQKLMLDLDITAPGAQRMVWRLLAENGMAKDARSATSNTRKNVKEIAKKAGTSAEEALLALQRTGRLRSTAAKADIAAADQLQGRGILQSPEWLDTRDTDGRRGVVGEWLAEEEVPPSAGARVFRRVTVRADLFDDPAGTVPTKDQNGAVRTDVVAAETDLVHARDVGGNLEVETVLNVKASAAKGMLASANVQNANFNAVLQAKAGDLVRLDLGSNVRYARIRSLAGLEGSANVDLTGKLKPSSAVALETVGPRGGGGFTRSLRLVPDKITAVANLLGEAQLVGSGEY